MKLKIVDLNKTPDNIDLGQTRMELVRENGALKEVWLWTEGGRMCIKKVDSYNENMKLVVPDIEEMTSYMVKGEIRGIPFNFHFDKKDDAQEKKDKMTEMNGDDSSFKCEIEEMEGIGHALANSSGRGSFAASNEPLRALFRQK